jgi:transposase
VTLGYQADSYSISEVSIMAKRPLAVRPLSSEERAELDELYRRARTPRLRTRAQMILLALEQGMIAPEIASIVRCCEETVRNWIRRFNAEGTEGLRDRPRPRAPVKVTPEYHERLLHVVRRRPRALGRPYSLWTLQRLADFMAEETGIRLSHEGVRLVLKKSGIKMSRPQHKISSPDPEYELKKRRLKPAVTT